MGLRQNTCYPFDHAGLYEIHVVGSVDESILEYLPGITRIRHGAIDDVALSEVALSEADMDVTVLTGWLPDQAALNGVLNSLYDRQYTLTLVRRVPSRSDDGECTA